MISMVKKALLALCLVFTIAAAAPIYAQETPVDTENLNQPLIVKEQAPAQNFVVRIYLKSEETLAGKILDPHLKFMVMQSEFNVMIGDLEKIDLEENSAILLRNGDRITASPAFSDLTFEHQASMAKMIIPVKEIIKIEFETATEAKDLPKEN